ncbi:MAG: alpha amylase C-terminal domain-containing protein [Kiritimatiellae bacterium]|nr:alpha amylase C-terminal domain-containing protein [Kiritimatiellia bacterium]
MNRRFPAFAAFLLLSAACASAAPTASVPSPEQTGAIVRGAAGARSVLFRVWAPNAQSVTVAGEFNGWRDEKLDREMNRTGGGASGYWFTETRKAKIGDKYLFRIDGAEHRDPAARAVAVDSKHGRVGVVVDPREFKWDAADRWMMPRRENLVLYELHPGTFADGIHGKEPPLERAVKRLDYLAAIGVNGIQLMPVGEFTGDHSWGYNPTDLYAIESAYGGAEALRTFVQECHRRGIAVLVDVVYNHLDNQHAAVWGFDGSNDARGPYLYRRGPKGDTEWGVRPNYGERPVRDWIHGAVRMFLDEYRMDGFRFDSVSHMRYTFDAAMHRADNPDGDRLLSDINAWMASVYPEALRIAEDNAFDGAGVGFQMQWHGHLRNVIADFIVTNDAARPIRGFAHRLMDLSFPAFQWVVFADHHDSAGDLNDHHRLPAYIDPANPKSLRARRLNLLANAIPLTIPGVPMLLQGVEMHEVADFSAEKALPWGGMDKGVAQAYAELIALRRNLKDLTPGLQGHDMQILDADDNAKVLAYYRRDDKKARDYATVVIFNFSPKPLKAYPVHFPTPGSWYCHYNSSSKAYFPDLDQEVGLRPAYGFSLIAPQTRIPLDIGAYSMQVFSKSKPAGAKIRPALEDKGGGDTTPFDEIAHAGAEEGGGIQGEGRRAYDPVAAYVEQAIAPFPYKRFPLP